MARKRPRLLGIAVSTSSTEATPQPHISILNLGFTKTAFATLNEQKFKLADLYGRATGEFIWLYYFCSAGAGGTTTMVSPPVLPCGPGSPGAPGAPGAPAGPGGPGTTGTTTGAGLSATGAAGGVTTVFSQALKPRTATAKNNAEYFILTPFM